MSSKQRALTDKQIAREPFTTKGQRIVPAPDRKGFFLVVGMQTKTWTIQIERKVLGQRRTHKKKLGQFPEMNCEAAYNEADIQLGELRSGKRKLGHPGQGPTLKEAWHRFRTGHLLRKKRAERTVEQYQDCIERTLKEWLDTPLRELAENPAAVAARHDDITKENGPYQANHAMRCVRAIYRHARKAHRELPIEHPASAVDWNPEEAKEHAMDTAALRRWWADWATIENPVRRELHLLSLLTASRRTALCEARWPHVKVSGRVLHQPKPKGGSKKAFDIPLSRAMLASLARLKLWNRVEHPASPWLFPSDTSASGHTEEVKENTRDGFKTGHALRSTWITQARACGAPKFLTEIIANHGKAGVDVHDLYVSVPALQAELLRVQEQVSRHMLKLATPEARKLLAVRSREARRQRAALWADIRSEAARAA